MRRKNIEHSLIQLTRDKCGQVTRTWISDYPSKAEAMAEARRIVDEDDPNAIVVASPADAWHMGDDCEARRVDP